MFDQNNDKSKYEDILKRYPKKRIILNEKYKEIYKDHYISNRGGKGIFNFFSQKMESWMHKKVSKIQAKNILELGAGNLNHVKYESNYLNYDIVEPFKDLYEKNSNKTFLRNIYSSLKFYKIFTNK